MKLSQRIRTTIDLHRQEYPDGDWKGVNDKLSDLFFESAPVLIRAGLDPWKLGNEGRAAKLEKMGL